MRILTRNQAVALDRIAIDEMGIPGTTLMGNAGAEVAKKAIEMLNGIHEPRVAIVCGKGNNGGDGFVTALELYGKGITPTIFSLPDEENIKGDARHYFLRCREQNLPIVHGRTLPSENAFDLIVDGLLGTGFRGELRDPLNQWTDWINQAGVPVLAIDIPSGVDANSGLVAASAVKATATVTMGHVKVGMLLEPGKQYCGEIIPVEIGFPAILDRLPGLQWETVSPDLPRRLLIPPPSDTYKHRQGKVLIVAGSTGMTGAATMCTLGALRSGAGLTVTCAPASLNPIYEVNLMEGMTLVCEDRGKGYFQKDNYHTIRSFFDWCDVLLIGPGLGSAPETVELVRELVLNVEKPVVIDADGLRIFRAGRDLFSRIKAPFIITPHYGELGAIIKADHSAIKAEFPEIIERFMAGYPGVLVAKNAPTCVAYQDKVVVNTSGNQGLATAGTGDVLAGIMAGFVAQGIAVFEAAQLAVFIHGKAGDLVVKKKGFRGLLASDVLRAIPKVIANYEIQ
ncbi:MAG: NAD(P)H-hydrate dehydratase [FCB group bacterium]|nr:NAD(P)H-hydrate dehydratase [FCB group bacterium]